MNDAFLLSDIEKQIQQLQAQRSNLPKVDIGEKVSVNDLNLQRWFSFSFYTKKHMSLFLNVQGKLEVKFLLFCLCNPCCKFRYSRENLKDSSCSVRSWKLLVTAKAIYISLWYLIQVGLAAVGEGRYDTDIYGSGGDR